MSTPVVDPSRARIQEAVSSSPFNIFNIVAIVLILVIGFYLYRRFTSKSPERRFPLVKPVSAAPEPTAAPVTVEEDVPDVTEEDPKEE
jgi:hypothetical protein